MDKFHFMINLFTIQVSIKDIELLTAALYIWIS